MAQAMPTTDKEMRGMLYNVIGDWRTEQLSFTRRRVLDVQDKLDALDNRRVDPSPRTAELRAKLEEQMAHLTGRQDERVAMVEEAYKRMIAFVDRRAPATE